MQFAHLKRGVGDYGDSLVLHDSHNVISNIALLKARTYLSFLMSNNLLAFEEDKESAWVRYYPKNMNLGPTPRIAIDLDPEIVAIIPTKLNMPAWEQPGTAMVHNTLEVQALFVEFLESSRAWLAKNPLRLEELKRNVRACQIAS